MTIETVLARHRERGVIAYATDRPTETIEARDLRPGMTIVTYSGYVADPTEYRGIRGVGVQYLTPVGEVAWHGGYVVLGDGRRRALDERVEILYEPERRTADSALQRLREQFGGAL